MVVLGTIRPVVEDVEISGWEGRVAFKADKASTMVSTSQTAVRGCPWAEFQNALEDEELAPLQTVVLAAEVEGVRGVRLVAGAALGTPLPHSSP